MMLFIEMFTLHRAWNGLTDDELMWEPPTEGIWTVRQATESRMPTPFITGSLAADFDAVTDRSTCVVQSAANALDGRIDERQHNLLFHRPRHCD